MGELLAAGRNVAIDNTNPSPQERAPLIAIGRAHAAAVRAVFIDVPLKYAWLATPAAKGAHVPVAGVLATRKRLVPPTVAEGFDSVDVVRG